MRDGLVGQDASLILGLMIAMRRDPELARTVRAQVVDDKREVFGEVIARAVTRGDLPATIDHTLFVEISSAMLFSRLFVTGEQLDDASIRHLVDAVLPREEDVDRASCGLGQRHSRPCGKIARTE